MVQYKKNIQTLLNAYLNKSRDAQKTVAIFELEELFLVLLEIRKSGANLFLAGNGGSASTCQHFAVDLGIGGIDRNSIIRSINLSDNQSAITAVANDRDFENIFSAQLSILGKPSDGLLVISASGNSQNLINVVKEARKLGMKTLALLGFDGGKLREICDHSILVTTDKGEYGVVEDIHLSICHNLTEALRQTK
jgi:D-sedoheptulose 7-phosphate isomerase